MNRIQRRTQLLEAARDVFASKGYHDAKVDDIVAAAQVAKGTFYLYFPDKRSVFAELVDGIFHELDQAILHVDVAADIEAQVRYNISAVLGTFAADPALTRILLSYAAGLDPAFVEKIQSFYGSVRVLLARALREGQALGIVAPGDADLYATFSIGGVKEVLLAYVSQDPPPPREALEEALLGLLQSGYLRFPPA